MLAARSFVSAAIVTLAIGIGATTAVLKVVEAVVLRPFPFPHADRVVDLHPVRDGVPVVTASNDLARAAARPRWRGGHAAGAIVYADPR
jgi:hypothetical protein